MIKEEIKALLSDVLPAVNFDAEFLFAEMDSLGIATALYVLSEKYSIHLDAEDVKPKNFKNLDAIVAMVRSKMILEAKIKQFALETPQKIAVECAGSHMTYSELWDAILKRADELRKGGLKSTRPYVFRATQDADFLVTYCAVHYLGAVAVPLEHQATEENFNAIKEEVEASEFSADIADTLYTTGTTGKSKGVMLSKTCLLSCANNFISDMGFSSDLLFIVSGPLNHIASLFKIHPILSAGGTLCILDGLKDMNAFFDVFNLPYEKFGTFMVPASLRLIMQFSYEKLCSLASKIAFIETGAAPIYRSDMEQLSRALPGVPLYNTYGGTEIGCVCAYNFNDGRYIEGCVGHTLKNSRMEVTPDGNVVVSGPTIMSGYVAAPEITAQVLRDGKIYGSDLGYIDEEGMLHLTGRAGDIINVGGFKVNPLDVEAVASSYPGIKECVCVEGKHPVIGTVLKLIVVLEDGLSLDKHSLAVYLRSKLDSYKVPTLYEASASLKRTYNGKLDRKAYKE